MDLQGDELKGRSEAPPRAVKKREREKKGRRSAETTSLASFLLALSAGNKNRRHESDLPMPLAKRLDHAEFNYIGAAMNYAVLQL